MRAWTRLLLAVASAAVPVALAASFGASCSTGSLGVDACRQIEEARCGLAPACTPGFDVDRCQRYYRDECLNGIQNATSPVDPGTLAPACIDALNSVAGCLDASTSSAACEALVPDASCYEVDAAATVCNVILACPEALAACAFVGTEVPDAGIDVTDASDDGDAASE